MLTLVAKDEIELGILVVTQMFTTPGVELAGPRWRGQCATSQSAGAARDLLVFLKGPTAIPVIKAQGMEPI
jgi:hypothetical protein